MISLVTTRYNTETWNERQRWMEKNNWQGSIYCTPIKPKESIRDTMIVLEMHNDENQIKAVSIVKKRVVPYDKRPKIYQDSNYTRYIYKSPYRLVIGEIELTAMEKLIIAILNELLFKGACHSKRCNGITEMPIWIMRNKRIDFLAYFRALLKRHYRKASNNAEASTSNADTAEASNADIAETDDIAEADMAEAL